MLIIPNQVTFLPLLKLYSALGLEGKFVAVGWPRRRSDCRSPYISSVRSWSRCPGR
jgi:hypothetical protein